MTEILFFGIAFIATFVGIVVFRRYGNAAGMLDIPNERSSHSAPTLRGAGIVIVIVCLSLYIAAAFSSGSEINWSYFIGASIVAAVSWIDDLRGLGMLFRLIVHGVVAAVLIAGSGPITEVYVPGFSYISFGPVSYIFTFLWVVWMITAYNFMDGIDGIAGAQAVVAGAGWSTVGFLLGGPLIFCFGGIIAFSSLGFLIHNWHPARVFMGDVGSAFLGFTFAAMPLMSSGQQEKSAWLLTAGLSFLWLFLFDTVFTFGRRLLRGIKAWLPHREHLYQRLVISGLGHGAVSLLYAGLTLAVAGVFIAAFIFGGIFKLLLVLTYVAVPSVVIFFAFRKKV